MPKPIQIQEDEKIKLIKSSVDGIIEKTNERDLDVELLPKEDLDTMNSLEKYIAIRNRNHSMSEKSLSKLTKCFWIPEQSTSVEKSSGTRFKCTVCPVDFKKLRLKDLIALTFKKSDEGKIICCICLGEISYQKVLLLQPCGDITCRKCLDNIMKKTQGRKCANCERNYDKVLELQEGKTGFSQHNDVISTSSNPCFKY